MSESVRQSNLFSAEDYKKVFKAYSFIDYTAYDFDSLKQALINYIQTYYPEDFNDYIESSEFIAIIELLAYFGTSLAFRTDLNSRENFIDTAERRESIIRLAQMVNYVPRRNIAANGLFKIAAVQTDQPLTDANGININDTTIFWNDPNNPDWFDQFIQVCNAAFSTINPFGRPSKSGTIGSIPTDLYQLNNILRLNVTYPITMTINGQQYPVDICNPDFVNNENIFERDPNPLNAFNFLYRNDSLGVSSSNTGFFLYFRQGNLINIDTNFEFPIPNRVFPIDIQNINQEDVYVQETDEAGNVITNWIKVPALAGENIIYNSIQFAERNIFDVISGANDTISIRFADGNFGNVPTGLFRTWIRVSANQALVIRPDSAQGLQINIPYIGVDQQQYTLRIIFNLEQTVSNASASETDEQIRLRAPEVFSTQSRMVNGSDYNVLPLIYGNQIAKIQAIDRTYSGQSRYLDLNDPTGFHRDLIIFGEDGALYRDNQNILEQVIEDSSNADTIADILVNTIQSTLRDPKVSTFFYDQYIPDFESTVRVNPPNTGRSLLDLVPSGLTDPSSSLFWKTSPVKYKNDTGYFSNTVGDTQSVALTNTYNTYNVPGSTYQFWSFINDGAVVKFGKNSLDVTSNNWATVNSVINDGIATDITVDNTFASIGPVELSTEEPNNFQAMKVYPAFRNTLRPDEKADIAARVAGGNSFWLYYNLIEDLWATSIAVDIAPGQPSLVDAPNLSFMYPPVMSDIFAPMILSDWSKYTSDGILYVNIETDSELGTRTYDITARGRVYVFESYRDVRFYWEPGQVVIDSASGLALQDNIEIMPFVNTNNKVNNNQPVIVDPTTSYLKSPINFSITGVYTQNDGYTDNSKVEVSLVDNDADGIADIPYFTEIVSFSDRIVFEYYANEISGYQSTRPWISRWGTDLQTLDSVSLYVYFPKIDSTSTELYGSPYIASQQLVDPYQIQNPGTVPGLSYIYMDETDLAFINKLSQLTGGDIPVRSIVNQLTVFFNNTASSTLYPWLYVQRTDLLNNKTDILNTYFFNKTYLVNPLSDPGYGIYYSLGFEATSDFVTYPTGLIAAATLDTTHFDKNGKVFTQNTTVNEDDRLPLYFKWSHYAPIDQRVDPSVSNIVDMIVITDGYYRDMLIWKNSNGSLALMPPSPTTEELRIQFQDLNKYKMVSDSIIWNSGKFKILFGTQADTELQATFKVVKSPSTNISDNEVKTKVIAAIDAYFDIRNWDFGEKFFYTELAAFIHQQLSKIISSVVIVPNNASSQFGNLFEIIANPTELFMSTATVNNVQIVANLTNQNLRV